MDLLIMEDLDHSMAGVWFGASVRFFSGSWVIRVRPSLVWPRLCRIYLCCIG